MVEKQKARLGVDIYFKLNISKLVERAVNIKVDLLNRYRKHVESEFKNEIDRISKQIYNLDLNEFKSSDDFEEYSNYITASH